MATGAFSYGKEMIAQESLDYQNGGKNWVGRNEFCQHLASLGEDLSPLMWITASDCDFSLVRQRAWHTLLTKDPG